MLCKCIYSHKIYIIYGWDGNVQFWVLGMFASNSPNRRNLIFTEIAFNNEGHRMTWRRRLVWLESLILYGQFLYWFYDTIIYSILKEVLWINSIFSPSGLIEYHCLPPKETVSVIKGRRDKFYVVDTPYLVMKGTKIRGMHDSVQFPMRGIVSSNIPDLLNLCLTQIGLSIEGLILTWRWRLVSLEHFILYGKFLMMLRC